jgi:environmental stress-induced protein Ves
MRLIRSTNYRRQPWKNGGGETIEIAVYPRDASVNDFDWRISKARVDADGAFSTFPSVDRTLTVLEGQGINLEVEGLPPAQITDQPHSFPGDKPTSASLINGPIVDLNVMTRRNVLSHRVSRLMLAGPRDMVVRSPVVLIYCESGAAIFEDDIAAALELTAGNTVFIESRPTDLRISPVGETRLILVEIGPA